MEYHLQDSVDYFAYPGGEFNSSIVDLVKQAGYKAACLVLSPATNTSSDKFWLFRNHLTENLNSLSDFYRLHHTMLRFLDFRVRRKLVEKLGNQEYSYPK